MPPSRRVFNGTAIMPTRNRSRTLRTTLASLGRQSVQPRRVVVIDGSDDDSTFLLVDEIKTGIDEWRDAGFELVHERARMLGAAAQRNQGMRHAEGETLLLIDDDLILEPKCIERLVDAMESDGRIGAVSALLTNQCFEKPGVLWTLIYKVLGGARLPSLAGRCFGPAIMMFPSDDQTLSEIVPVDWMPTTCALYRRSATPDPLFDDFFKGYSYMEDATLALRIGCDWRLVNVPTARAYHDSQPGEHKADITALSLMEMVNRHYVLSEVLRDRSVVSLARLFAFEIARAISLLRSSKTRRYSLRALAGKIGGMFAIMQSRMTKDPR